jgi:hypothetical protein
VIFDVSTIPAFFLPRVTHFCATKVMGARIAYPCDFSWCPEYPSLFKVLVLDVSDYAHRELQPTLMEKFLSVPNVLFRYASTSCLLTYPVPWDPISFLIIHSGEGGIAVVVEGLCRVSGFAALIARMWRSAVLSAREVDGVF